MSDTSRPKPRQDADGRFLTGNIGGGRSKGSRNKLGEAFLADLFTAWELHGADAISRVIAERPHDFLKVVASILPKEVTAEVTQRFVARMPGPTSTVEEWEAKYSPRAITQ